MSRSSMSPFVILCIVGCGGSTPQPNDASSTELSREPASSAAESSTEGADKSQSEEKSEKEKSSESTSEKDDSSSKGETKKQGGGGPEPAFPEGASVAKAIAAVPQGTQRSNIDQETLGEPLQNAATYEPCKVGTQHFKLKVAVWNGHAVGVDVTTPNKALAACIDKQVRSIEWRDKVRSLNTVEYSM